MRKFVILSKSGTFTIVEVEVEKISTLEDPSVAWGLYPGEYKARIMKPESFHMRIEKLVNGKREFVDVPDVWYSFAFYDELELAIWECSKLIQQEFEFKLRKYQTPFTQEDVVSACAGIEVKRLAA